MNLYDTITEQMATDDNSTKGIAERLKRQYKNVDKHDKEVIDELLINLVGWSMPTLIKKEKE